MLGERRHARNQSVKILGVEHEQARMMSAISKADRCENSGTRRHARHRPEPRGIFQREHDDAEDGDGREQHTELRIQLRHRSEDHRGDVEHDDANDDLDEARPDRIGEWIVLQQFVEAIP